MDLKTATDEELMHALQLKSLEALEELYDRLHRTALAVAYRVLGDRTLAEDVIQETFLAVWRQADAFRPERGNARSWIFSIVRHRAIDITRGGAFQRERFSLDEFGFEPRYPDPWLEVSRTLENERISQAVESLPEEQREAVTLAYFSGLTHQEISDQTGTPLGTVKGRIRLGMQKLRSMLTGADSGEEH